LSIILRLATESDLPLMMAWRSSPVVFAGFYSQTKPLTWQEHLGWWKSRNRDWRCFIIELLEGDILRPVGVLNIGQLESWTPELGLYLGETSLWGRGIGAEALNLALLWLENNGYQATHTTIPKSNKRAMRLFSSAGFEKTGKARVGEIRVERILFKNLTR